MALERAKVLGRIPERCGHLRAEQRGEKPLAETEKGFWRWEESLVGGATEHPRGGAGQYQTQADTKQDKD